MSAAGEFAAMGLDDRLLNAIEQLKWATPTAVQVEAVPAALQGKDVLARARTGSGKTGAYVLPALQGVLARSSEVRKAEGGARAALASSVLILVPTKELCSQVAGNVKELARFCSRAVSCCVLSGAKSMKAQKAALASRPDILIGTPSRVNSHVRAKNLDLSQSLELLVIDEADLVFSYGYKDDLTALLEHLPKLHQTILMSATVSDDVEELKDLTLRNPVVVRPKESDVPDQHQLAQYTIKCLQDRKFLVVYALFKLNLVQGKTLIFVNSIDQCYRLKLFLEQLSISSCVLNSELPLNSRRHVVEQFNKGLYEYIIASDEATAESAVVEQPEEDETAPAAEPADDMAGKSRKRRRVEQDKEYGVSRGVDFKDVKNVLNFDFPVTAENYVHRVGRTARGHSAGLALSLVCDTDLAVVAAAEQLLDESSSILPHAFKMDAIKSLEYRAEDALRRVTRAAVRNARRKEIRAEILNSEKLKAHFEDNPRDLEVLRHDKLLQHPLKIQPEMAHVPDYLLPPAMRAALPKARGGRKGKARGGSRSRRPRAGAANPLKSFSYKRKRK